ncbi:MAG TPA: molybdopterin-dependent oxidoreductase [Steroidobacteraceae bacterium]|nr:molybdopterin-dependent oxidoreductase [Steroidobacteraceae bacterium]
MDHRYRPQTATHWGVYEPQVVDGRIDSVKPHERDSDPSPIGRSLTAATDRAVRIAQPMVRAGYLERGPRLGANARGREPFVAVDWDTALELVAERLQDVKQRHGNEAIFGGSYGWASAGRFHHAQSQVHRFLNLFGGYVRSVNSYSCAAMEVIVPHVLCSIEDLFVSMPGWREIARHGQLVVAFGGLATKNLQVNAGGIGNHTTRHLQLECRRAGVSFVNVSPLRVDIDRALEARWLPIVPNTDVAMMLGLAHTLVVEGLHDKAFLADCCTGYDRFEAYLLGRADGQPKSAEWAETICGIAARTLRELAREIATHRTLITASWSVQRQDHGEQVYWMAIALAAMSGSMGRRGGGFGAGYAAEHAVGNVRRRARLGAFPRGANPLKTFIPVARIADMLLAPGTPFQYNGQDLTYPDIRLVYWCGGNPFHHHQDLNRLRAAWQRPETIIVHEPFWNALAKHADIVLPVTTPLERDDLSGGNSDTSLIASRRAIEPFAAARHDYDIFSALARRLGFEAAFTEGLSDRQWIERLYESTRQYSAPAGLALPPFEEFWQAGWFEFPPVDAAPVLCGPLRENPSGAPLQTPSGRVEIFSERIESFGYADCPGHPTWIAPTEWLGAPLAGRYPLHLISNQPRTRLHSQYDHGVVSRESKVKGREPALMHPADAAAREIASGDLIRIFNDRGACLAGVVLSEDVRRGVIQLATGAWLDPDDPAAEKVTCVHGNPNVLTRDAGTSRLAQGPSPMSTLVQVERYRGTPPPLRAFVPPVIESLGT